jgi:hypothetical protein
MISPQSLLVLVVICVELTFAKVRLSLPLRMNSGLGQFNASFYRDKHVLFTAAATTEITEKMELNAIDLCLCGAVATAFGDFVMHPIDTIKITQQTAGTISRSVSFRFMTF